MYLKITELFEPLVVASFVLEFGQTGWAATERRGREGRATAAGFDFGQEIGAQRFESRRLARQQAEQRAHVVDQLQSDGLLFAVQLKNGWRLGDKSRIALDFGRQVCGRFLFDATCCYK